MKKKSIKREKDEKKTKQKTKKQSKCPGLSIEIIKKVHNCVIAMQQYHVTIHQPCGQMKLLHGYQPIRGLETRSKYDNIYLLHGRACDIAELLHKCGLIHTRATILQCCMSYHAISILSY